MKSDHLKEIIREIKSDIKNISHEIFEKRIRYEEIMSNLNNKKDELSILLEKLEFVLDENTVEKVD